MTQEEMTDFLKIANETGGEAVANECRRRILNTPKGEKIEPYVILREVTEKYCREINESIRIQAGLNCNS